MDAIQEFSARIHHSCREGYFHAMKNASQEAMRKFPNDCTFKFYHAVSLLLEKKTSDALRELEPLLNENPVSLASCIASVDGHRAFAKVDREEVASLEVRIREAKKAAPADVLYFAGLYMNLTAKNDKAKEYLDRAIKYSSQHDDAVCLRGWVEMKLGPKERSQKDPSEYFETVLKSNRKHMDAILGQARYCELSHQFETGLEKLNELLAFYPNWIPSLVEKMKLALCIQDWDQAMDICKRILSIESDNLEAYRLKILYSLCRDGDLNTVVRSLDTFFSLCKKHEPNNAKYFVENARMFSQLASYEERILAQTMKFVKFATELELDNAEIVADVGRILLLMGKNKEAYQEFRAATNMDNTSISALYGLISCQLADGNIDLAAQQLEFLRELATTIETSSDLHYLTAVMAKKRKQPSEVVIGYLNEAVDAHFRQMRGFAFNVTYMKAINPDLVVKIVREYLLFAPQEPVGQGMLPPVCVRQASMILETVIKVCPKHRDALFISAQIKYLCGDTRGAIGTLSAIMTIDSSLLEAHLLMAQVQLAQNEYKLASQTLENALSSNFKVREHPKYHLLLARVQKHNGELEKALKTLDGAMNLVRASKKMFTDTERTSPVEFGLSDNLALYLELVTVYRAMGKPEEAKKMMDDALVQFKGTDLEGRISLTQAEEMIEKGEIEKALDLLRIVTPEQNHFIEAKKLMANIFLNYRRDPKLYCGCFIDIANQNPTPSNLILLGDAYMTVQDPDKAIEVYEVALAKNPRDATLTSKMGQALVVTHQFTKAINYYKEAVKSDDNFNLRFDLASLQQKLKQWDRAEKTIQQALTDLSDSSLTGLLTEVKLLVLLSKVQIGAGTSNLAIQSLVRAKETQNRVLKRAMLDQPSILNEQKLQFSKICQMLGELAEKQSDIEFAIRSMKETLDLLPEDVSSLTALSKLYMKAGDHIHCQQTCQQLLKVNTDASEASVMLGELFFRKFDFNSAAFHFQQFLDHNPTHWKSLMWFIESQRRCGMLKDAIPYLQAAALRVDSSDPGYGYCQGLFEWYSGNANSALKMLNKARKDSVYGQKALLLMIDIYLNPTGGVLGGDAMDGGSGDSSLANGSGADLKDIALSTAETLIRVSSSLNLVTKELTIRTGEEKFRRQILECFVLLATKNKNRMEKAVQELSGLVTTDQGRESVMLVYALATGYMFIKQTPRARNQLKRVIKSNWTVDDAEYLERCWLLLADIYIQSSKFDLATDLIKKILTFNKSCMKATEYLGFIMEKEQAYADAAINYEQAWKLTNCSNPSLGYKLGFNYLKAKRYTDAIDVCHVVLGKHPNYPKIKKDIMDKARASLRA